MMENNIFYEDDCYVIRLSGNDFTLYHKAIDSKGNRVKDLKIITLDWHDDITDFICHFIKKVK